MEPVYIYPTIAAFTYAVAASFSKHALNQGVGILRLSFVINLIFVPVFALLLIGHEGAVPWSQVQYPIFMGVVFFLGQMFTFAAIRMGDVSLQTPVMGTKAVFVVMLAGAFGVQAISPAMVLAAIISMLGVALLGFSGGKAPRIGLTLLLAMLSALCFAGSDIITSHYGGDFGPSAFLFIAMLVNALLSFALIPFFNAPLREVPRASWLWASFAALLMAGQALLLNYSLARYGDAASANIFYSTRGLWSVLISLLVLHYIYRTNEALSRRLIIMRFAGASLMCVAIAVLFL
ncbi:MAG: DMT family transporter [Opitutaceae bacterium]